MAGIVVTFDAPVSLSFYSSVEGDKSDKFSGPIITVRNIETFAE